MQTLQKNTRSKMTREVLRSNDTAKRSAEIVVAARELYEEKGLAHTSIQDITNYVGVTRSLFYHYFQNKEEVTMAVLDQYIVDFLQALESWHSGRANQSPEDSLRAAVDIVRAILFEKNTFRMALAAQENAALYLDFVNRFAAQGADFLVKHPVFNHMESEHLYEKLYVLIVGVVGYMREHPDADDEMLVEIIGEMLNLQGTGAVTA